MLLTAVTAVTAVVFSKQVAAESSETQPSTALRDSIQGIARLMSPKNSAFGHKAAENSTWREESVARQVVAALTGSLFTMSTSAGAFVMLMGWP